MEQCAECGLNPRQGRHRKCRQCLNAKMRAWRQAGREKPDWVSETRASVRAHSKMLLRRGKLTREPCLVCKAPAEMHHPDYGLPDLVIWLCRPHHLELHRRERLAS